MSSWKSSIAGYRISSTDRDRRWISSTNRTSRSSSLVRMAARSPARSSAGPDVTCSVTPISAAAMPASVVLPSPGGPANSRWSTAWPRRRAASMTIARCSFSSRWPTKSASSRGRSPTSTTSSVSSATPGSRNSSRTAGPQRLERVAQQRSRRRRRRRSAARAARRGSPPGRSRARPAPRGRRRPPSRRPDAPTGSSIGTDSRFFSSTSRRSAVLRPMPGTSVSEADVAAGDDVDERAPASAWRGSPSPPPARRRGWRSAR